MKDFNNLKNNNLKISQKLIVPIIKTKKSTTKTNTTAKNSKKQYTIKKGDTLLGISQKFKVSLKDLKKINNITTSSIKIGEKIAIP